MRQENTAESNTMVMPNSLEDILFEFNSALLSSPMAAPDKTICPEVSTKDYTCNASLFGLAVDERRYERYCCQDNYDDCPIYLAKSLRLYRCEKEC